MNVILPVAGLGTRLRPHTYSRPKPLVTLAGQTVLDHVLDRLKALDLDRVVFVTGYLGEQIEDYVRSHYDFDAVFVEQTEPKGQSHAIIEARGHVTGPTLVLFPDMVFEADMEGLVESGVDGAIFVKEVDDPSRFGVVVLEDGKITRLVEKPDTPVSNLAVMGVYYFRDVESLFDAIDRQIDQNIQTKGEYFIADAIQLMVNDGAKFTAPTATVWEDCGTRDALLDTNRYLLQKIDDRVPGDGVIFIPPVYIDPTASVSQSVVGPYTSIGAGAVIEASIIRDSIVDEGAVVRGAMLERSLVGRNAILNGKAMRVNVGDASELDLVCENGNGV